MKTSYQRPAQVCVMLISYAIHQSMTSSDSALPPLYIYPI